MRNKKDPGKRTYKPVKAQCLLIISMLGYCLAAKRLTVGYIVLRLSIVS
jgi:hypothetical protein